MTLRDGPETLCDAAGGERDDRGPPHCCRLVHEVHGERAAAARRLSRRLGVDRAAHVRIRHTRLPPGDVTLHRQAHLLLPGIVSLKSIALLYILLPGTDGQMIQV